MQLSVLGEGRTSVVNESQFKPEDPGFDPLAEQGEKQFSVARSQLVGRLACAWTPFVCTARTHICPHVKDPISICRKRVGLTVAGMETRKHWTEEKQ